MAVTKPAARRPRGLKGYIFRERQAFDLDQVRQFLRFLYAEYRSGLAFRADLVALLWHVPIEQAPQAVRDGAPTILPDTDLEECFDIQETIRRGFECMMERARSPKGFFLFQDQKVFRAITWADRGEIFYVEPHHPFPGPGYDIAEWLLKKLAGHMNGLRTAAIRRCQAEGCRRYFLDSELRGARWCSQPCRVRVWEKRRGKRRGPSARKGG